MSAKFPGRPVRAKALNLFGGHPNKPFGKMKKNIYLWVLRALYFFDGFGTPWQNVCFFRGHPRTLACILAIRESWVWLPETDDIASAAGVCQSRLPRRASVEASNNNVTVSAHAERKLFCQYRVLLQVWPFTYSQCPSEHLEEANQDPPKQQRINECVALSPGAKGHPNTSP